MSLLDACVMLTRSFEDNLPLRRLCEQGGINVVENPLISTFLLDTPTLRNTLEAIGEYDAVIATSGNALRAVRQHVKMDAATDDTTCYVVGDRTANRAREIGWEAIHPEGVRGADDLFAYLEANGVATEAQRRTSLARREARGRLLWLHGQLADTTGAERLRQTGFTVDMVCCYETRRLQVQLANVEKLRSAKYPITTFYSPSAVKAFVDSPAVQESALGLSGIACVAIGKTTAAAIVQNGLLLAGTAQRPDDSSVYDMICNCLRQEA